MGTHRTHAIRLGLPLSLGVGLLALGLAAPAAAQTPEALCGPRPLPDPGCVVAECVDGRWQQDCYDPAPEPRDGSCGPRPLPDAGCEITRCVDGAWEQECIYGRELLCGPKPEPPVGCRVAECIEGHWQLDCM